MAHGLTSTNGISAENAEHSRETPLASSNETDL